MFPNSPEVLTVDEAAKMLKISSNSLYRLVKEQIIGCVRVGRKILIPKLALEQYLRSALHKVKA